MNELNENGRLPLDLALSTEQMSIAASLVDHKVNLNQLDKNGRSSLHLAILRADPQACHFLLEHGAQVNLPETDSLNTPLHLIAQANNINLTDVASAVLKRNGDLNCQNRFGETPLHVCIKCNNREVFDLLLEAKCNLELFNMDGKPALWYALLGEDVNSGDDSLAFKLVQAGADVNSHCNSLGEIAFLINFQWLVWIRKSLIIDFLLF